LRRPPERSPDDDNRETPEEPDVLARPRALAAWSNDPPLSRPAPENALSGRDGDALDDT
jgi:hypothetical protein